MDIVHDDDAHAADGHARDHAQIEAGHRVVAVAEDRRDVCDLLELVQDVVRADVAGVQDRCERPLARERLAAPAGRASRGCRR